VKHTEGEDHAVKRAEAERLRECVAAGEPFGAVASRASDCPENGGDLGYFARGTMVEEFEEVIFSSPLNTLTPVFQTRFGYHIAIVYDIKSQGILPLDEVRVYVERILHKGRQDKEIARRLEALRSKAVIAQI
jgi:parvulin-like peptidyl-prolyl isomerase